MNKPPYVDKLMDLLAENLPKGTNYVIIVQRPNEPSPNIVSTVEDPLVLGASLKAIAVRLGGGH